MGSSHASSATEISSLRVGIVGGSISGCVTAVELARLGADVTVFERSHRLEDRGAGIGLALSLIETLKQRDLIDDDTGHIPVFRRRFVVRCNEDSPHLGRTIWEQSFASGSTNWDVVYRQLRQRVPDGHVPAGSKCCVHNPRGRSRASAGVWRRRAVAMRSSDLCRRLRLVRPTDLVPGSRASVRRLRHMERADTGAPSS